MYPSNDYTLSSNPPNPRTTFRVGDWICPSHSCGAHNFGRNTSCIGCGSLRPSPSNMTQLSDSAHHPPQPIHTGLRPAPSPRFSSTPSTPSSPASSASSAAPPPPPPAHPLLTPSGKSFAKGGKVQNISPDPLVPCVMYWPENEPLPTRGQIRPNSVGSQPPILNTGNRGPISHQPGDWICLKCNYLNWRRRKVCQTCYPYAEGNGDSISVAVQAERIALLTNVLAQTRAEAMILAQHPQQQQQPRPVQRSLSLTPPNYPYPSANGPHVHRSHSQNELGSQFAMKTSPPPSQPILYQTPLPRARQHPILKQQQQQPLQQQDEWAVPDSPLYMPTPLLPSFLQDLVHSPTLSPASTSSSSAELLSEDDEISVPSSFRPSARHGSIGQERQRARVHVSQHGSVDELTRSMSTIWSLDGEESKTYHSAPMYFGPFGRQTGKRGASLERLPE